MIASSEASSKTLTEAIRLYGMGMSIRQVATLVGWSWGLRKPGLE